MTNEEAKNYLLVDFPDGIEAVDLAIKALEKQIPQRPKLQRGCVGAYCPQCKGFVGDRLISYQYCRKCGQAIDWSEE